MWLLSLVFTLDGFSRTERFELDAQIPLRSHNDFEAEFDFIHRSRACPPVVSQ